MPGKLIWRSESHRFIGHESAILAGDPRKTKQNLVPGSSEWHWPGSEAVEHFHFVTMTSKHGRLNCRKLLGGFGGDAILLEVVVLFCLLQWQWHKYARSLKWNMNLLVHEHPLYCRGLLLVKKNSYGQSGPAIAVNIKKTKKSVTSNLRQVLAASGHLRKCWLLMKWASQDLSDANLKQ